MSPRNLFPGSTGFVGSHLIERQIQADEEVFCIDSYFTTLKDNIRHWLGHPKTRNPIFRNKQVRHNIARALFIGANIITK